MAYRDPPRLTDLARGGSLFGTPDGIVVLFLKIIALKSLIWLTVARMKGLSSRGTFSEERPLGTYLSSKEYRLTVCRLT
jgi:hypothetical protein